MPRLIPIALLALSLTSSLVAAPAFVGERFVLTNTRYAPATGVPLLLANDRDVFLFWNNGTRFRATRVGTGEAGPSQSIMQNSGSDTYSVAWTGSKFLMVVGRTHFDSYQADDDIAGQLIDAKGAPIGAPFQLLHSGIDPKIAFDGTSALMLYHGHASDELYALRMTPNGTILPMETQATGVRGSVQGFASNGRSFAAVVSDRFERKVVLFDRNGVTRSQVPLVTDYRGVGTIASDGTRYLVADGTGGRVTTQIIQADGTAGAPLDLVPPMGRETAATSVAWTGSQWIVAYTIDDSSGPSYVVARLNATTRAVEAREEGRGNTVSLAARGGRLTLAWLPAGGNGIRVAESSIAAGPGVTASYASTNQQIQGTATAKHGTLVLWDEDRALRAGVRSSDGTWKETELPIQPVFAAIAATDGDGFAVLAASSNRTILMRLDRDANPIGNAMPLDWAPDDILWTGRDYLLYRAVGNDLEVATLGPSGVLSPRRIVTMNVNGPAVGFKLASNGNGFYAVWILWMQFACPPMPPYGASGIRLGADLQPLDEEPTTFENDTSYGASVAWDGTQYVVAWSGYDGVRAARVSAEGMVGATQTVTRENAYGNRVQSIAGGVVIDWQQYPLGSSEATPALAFLGMNGASTTPVVLWRSDRRLGSYAQQIATLPDGNAAVVESAIADAAPVDGATRIHMTVVSRNALPERPGAPQAAATLQNGTVNLRWTAPQQPVTGYRVEYRRDDGPWLETDTALSAAERSILVATNGQNVTLRVRAWNEAGPGAYSNAVVVNSSKRAVRLR